MFGMLRNQRYRLDGCVKDLLRFGQNRRPARRLDGTRRVLGWTGWAAREGPTSSNSKRHGLTPTREKPCPTLYRPCCFATSMMCSERSIPCVDAQRSSCLLQTQYGECSLRPMDCLPQCDFRPAETHRDPSGDQLQHKLAGVTTIVRHVIGKLDADPPLWHIAKRCLCCFWFTAPSHSWVPFTRRSSIGSAKRPQRVISGHFPTSALCPLYPRKRTSAGRIALSALWGRLVSELHANEGHSSTRPRDPFPIAVSCRFIARLPRTRHGARRAENLPRP